ncbi:MAG: Uma2 family endonuclease [bacterium]
MSTKLLVPARRHRFVDYPEGDGKPMAETPIHVLQIIALYMALRWWFLPRQDSFVGANMFLYYREGDPKKRIAPDVLVALGVPDHVRLSYKLWEEKQAPQAVFEITSCKTRKTDFGSKREIYAHLGVAEYYLFDPLGHYLNPPLRGYQLVDKEYVERELEALPQFAEKSLNGAQGWRLVSNSLQLEFHAVPSNKPGWRYELQVYDPATGKLVASPDEEREKRILFEQIALDAQARVEAATKARQAVEAELTRLRAEIEKFRRSNGTDAAGQ